MSKKNLENYPMKEFVFSLNLENHPIQHEKQTRDYYILLTYLISQVIEADKCFSLIEKVEQYKNMLMRSGERFATKISKGETIEAFFQRMCSRGYCYYLLCDIALLFLDEAITQKAADYIYSILNRYQSQKFPDFVSALQGDGKTRDSWFFVKDLVEQYHKNMEFQKLPEMRIMVTANMSAGKSTLINALVGKSVARTSQEVCTGNICYIYNKPYEDYRVHLKTDSINIDASTSELFDFGWSSSVSIASYFQTCCEEKKRLCIIDTPGVNSALNKEHGEITKTALLKERYDKLIYVVNGNKIGTDEEMAHLKWLSENIPKKKVIFVLNKADEFKTADDDIESSMQGVLEDLKQFGYQNPEIYPLSAYAGMLAKIKASSVPMSEDEEEEYMFYQKKFSRERNDLSKYGKECTVNETDDERTVMMKRCGLFRLEQVIYGGKEQ